jgi:catechol 2,3-dioxygenase-like lactoylglutathione lyase family enzyme
VDSIAIISNIHSTDCRKTMSLKFDHAVIAVKDLDAAIQDYRDLGFTVFRGGVHANRATENALIVFEDGTYLELLARTKEEPLAGLVDFSVLLNNGEGLVGYALGSDDLEADAARLKAKGLKVGDIISGERRRGDGTLIQWKLALIDDGFAPFLIQDVTPRELRVSNDPANTTHPNRAVRVKGVGIAMRSLMDSSKRYKDLFGVPQGKYNNIGSVTLREHRVFALDYRLDDPPKHLRMFAGGATQAEIDAADPALEPKGFGKQREYNVKQLAHFRRETEEERVIAVLLAERAEALFAIELVRAQGESELFTLERTHGVRFRQITGASRSQGKAILVGLDDFDWSSVEHAHGVATDVPDLLRALASDDGDVRCDAYGGLYNTIIHQDSVYSASVEAIPFLMQLLNAPEVEDKNLLLSFLLEIGEGPVDYQERAQIIIKNALPLYLAQFSHPDAEIRRRVTGQLVSLYGGEIATLEPLLRDRIRSDVDPSVRAKCVEGLAKLWTGIASEKLSDEQVNYFAALMRDRWQPSAVQSQAAAVLLKDNPQHWTDEVLALFYRLMQTDEAALENLEGHELRSIFYTITGALYPYPEKEVEWVLAQAQHLHAEIRACVSFSLEQLVNFRQQPVSLVLPTMMNLLRDPSPDVRRSAVGFFYRRNQTDDVVKVLKDLAANDPSVMVRAVARHALKDVQ